jgi:glycosyltransferase involved in cell wall biosynthesis
MTARVSLDDWIRGTRFVVSSNGFADGPAEGLVPYLLQRHAREVLVVKHPLVADARGAHTATLWREGHLAVKRHIRLPFMPPFTYLFDLLTPRLPITSTDVWIGFNNLNTFRGLRWRGRGRACRVIFSCVDFTPDRFGRGSAITAAYNWLDRRCSLGSDEIWSVSEACQRGRLEAFGLFDRVRAKVVPMGVWIDRCPCATSESFRRGELVFLGHLLEKQGLQVAIRALPLLGEAFSHVTIKVIGAGPFEAALKQLAEDHGVGNRVRFLGFVDSHMDVERELAGSAAALAMYVPELASFSRYGDPGKLKAYAAAGLPVMLTDVPPNAAEIARDAGGAIVGYEPEAVAAAIREILGDEARWVARSARARAYAAKFDWNAILDDAFGGLMARHPLGVGGQA